MDIVPFGSDDFHLRIQHSVQQRMSIRQKQAKVRFDLGDVLRSRQVSATGNPFLDTGDVAFVCPMDLALHLGVSAHNQRHGLLPFADLDSHLADILPVVLHRIGRSGIFLVFLHRSGGGEDDVVLLVGNLLQHLQSRAEPLGRDVLHDLVAIHDNLAFVGELVLRQHSTAIPIRQIEVRDFVHLDVGLAEIRHRLGHRSRDAALQRVDDLGGTLIADIVDHGLELGSIARLDNLADRAGRVEQLDAGDNIVRQAGGLQGSDHVVDRQDRGGGNRQNSRHGYSFLFLQFRLADALMFVRIRFVLAYARAPWDCSTASGVGSDSGLGSSGSTVRASRAKP